MRGRLRERELDTDRESFEATVTRFSKFSWTERYPKKIICVWPEDILARRKRFVYARVPAPSGNAGRAQEIYGTATELLEMMYSPGHESASFCTRPFASQRLCDSSRKCRVPSVR